jgi:signal transduction histidine kinase
LRSVVDEVLLTLRPTLRRKPYAVDVDVPESLAMDSYPGPLGQVLINLINNALLHAFDGREQGRIRFSAKADGEDQLLLCVEDDGLGIPAAHLDRIFDPFFTTRLGQGGSGLGLHICFSLVNSLLGGGIEAGASAELGGAAFTLRLPRVAPVAQASDEATLP